VFTNPTGICVRAHLLRYEIAVCGPEDSTRAAAETFARECVYRTHGASIRTFSPTLLLLTDASGSLHGVAGCRAAAEEDLFVERYLSRPIEELLAERGGAPALRDDIVEVGKFVGRSSRAARSFMALLPFFLLDHEYAWVTFMASAGVRRLLHDVGARCVDLGAADGGSVRGGADDWGWDWTHDAHVMAGYLPLAREIAALRDAVRVRGSISTEGPWRSRIRRQ
jgi:hypothetical protein